MGVARVVLFFLLLTTLSLAQVLWVSPSGSDILGDGSSDKPLATIGAAVLRAPETGGTIVVREGTYNGAVRIGRKFSNWLVIRAEHPYRARIAAAQLTSLSLVDAAMVEVSGFDIYRSTEETQFPLAMQIARSQDIILRDNIIHDSQNNDILKINEGSRRLLIIGNIFFNQEGPAGQHIDVNGCNDVVIRDNLFFNDFKGSNKTNKRDTGSYIIIKNSSELPESRRFHVTSNIFFNWEGSVGKNYVLLGEDAKWFYETEDVLIENNLMIGNGTDPMRAAFGSKGARDVIFRNNTITGRQPGGAYAMRLNREGYNPQNRNLKFLNNVWSDPAGGMQRFSDGPAADSDELELKNNLYWNGGKRIPPGTVLSATDDPNAVEQDPLLDTTTEPVLPRWTGDAFLAGSRTIREEFERLVRIHGTPGEGSPLQGRSLTDASPTTDILDRLRDESPDLGAVEIQAGDPPLRVVAGGRRFTGGYPSDLNQIILARPAGEEGLVVGLTSSDPERVKVPEFVTIAPGTAAVSFRIESQPVTDPIPVVITATAGEWTRSLSIEIRPEEPATLHAAPDVLISGTPSTRNIVYIEGVAPPEGATVELVSSSPELVEVPSTVRVAPGRSYSEYFPVRTRFTADRKSVPVQVKWKERTAAGNIHLTASTFRVKLYTDNTLAGSRVDGNRLYLDRVAPSGGVVVQLVSSEPELLSVPESVTVPEGESMVNFSFQARAATVRKTAYVTAHLDGQKSYEGCDIVPLSIVSLIGPPTVTANSSVNLRVALNGPAPEPGLPIKVETGGPASAPVEVSIPAGQNFAVFPIKVNPHISTDRRIEVKASYLGRTITYTTVAGLPTILQLYTVPRFFSGGNESGSIRISAPAPPGGTEIRLIAQPAGAVDLPATVMVPEGSDQTTFKFRINPTSVPVQVLLTAHMGESSQERGFDILPADLVRFELVSVTVTGGGNLGVVLTLRGIPPPETRIQITSSAPDVVPPATFNVPTTGIQLRTNMPTQKVTEEQTVVLKATMDGSSLERSITIRP